MKVLVIGSGGREHALCWKLRQSPLLKELYCAPANPGIAQIADPVPIPADQIHELADFAAELRIDLTVVGPELPLTLGIAAEVSSRGLPLFGPRQRAAELEGSKVFAKEFMKRHGIPTADFEIAHGAEEVRRAAARFGFPVVLKADGLAAGKGVMVTENAAEAEAAIDTIMVARAFGAAGAEVVIEERMVGPEASFFALVDGRTVLPLASAQDHKRAYDGDRGPNTGGVGAFSPSVLIDEAMQARVMAEIIEPTVRAMAAEGRPYQGVLYAGLMLTAEGPKLLEYNVRFGDPECQVLVARLKSDLLPALLATADSALAAVDLRWRDDPAVCVVMAAAGYPGSYRKGAAIGGLAEAGAVEGVTVFHAGTRAGPDGAVLVDGGRVLGVTATGGTLAIARQRAYAAVDRIAWDGGWCRRDIAAPRNP